MAGFVDKFKRMWDAPEDEYEYDEYGYADEDDYYDYDEQPAKKSRSSESPTSRVIDIHATAKLKVGIFKPERFGEETRNIADEIINTNTVVLNLEDTNKDMARRIIDFLSGVTYAKHGKIKKVASNTYIVIPSNVDLTGDDLLDELENSGVYF